jgi:RhtB (resistance to homoserine/threonine) family protein
MSFFTITLVGLLAIISPGPDFLIVTQNSLQYGRKTGLQTAIGVSLANLCHVLLNIIGIGLIISKSIVAFTILKYLGAMYLIYFGFKAIRSGSLNNNQQNINKNKEFNSGFPSGFFCSIFNPKACLFYLSLFSVIIPVTTTQSARLLYGVWLSLLSLLWFAGVAYFFTNQTIQNKFFNFKSWLEKISGTLLIGCGCKLLWLK